MEQIKCKYYKCTRMIEQYPGKRARLYCSDAHRKAAQRLREQGEQIARDALAEQKMKETWEELPETVIERLKKIQKTYGVYAALAATQAVMEYKNVTDQVSQKAWRS
jgi:hypothetical protein